MELENDLVNTDAQMQLDMTVRMNQAQNDSRDQDENKFDSQYTDTVPQDDEEADLCGLVFGHDELPSNLMSHLPSIVNPQKKGRFTQDINLDFDAPQKRSDSLVIQDRILIVDDEPFNIDAIKIVTQCATANLNNFDFKNRVDTATNGLKAIEMVKKRTKDGYTYKLILMDCNMPQMDGCQATEKIIAYLKDSEVTVPKIVGISGHIEEKYIHKAIQSGMSTVVGKPARIVDL